MGLDVTADMPIGAAAAGRTSFYYSFAFLPRIQKEAIKTVYAFCRTTDDIVDNTEDVNTNLDRLHRWREELERSLTGSSQYTILNQLSAIAKRFNIPMDHFHDLVRGVEMDLVKNRYATFDELYHYCTLVASSVGLMTLGIFGAPSKKAGDYAINLGVALQLTNIIRDVGIDARYGRIYIPKEDLDRFGYTERELLSRQVSSAFYRLMEFQADRAEEYYRKAQELLPREERRHMFAATIMGRIYYHTLLRIRRQGFNVFDQEIALPRPLQILIALKYWIKQRIFGL
jgi:15-cis-phytoene synthase